MFVRRLGSAGEALQCAYGNHCAQILEMTDGHIAAVGELITEQATKAMLPGPGVGPTEAVVKLPRSVFAAACADFRAT